MAHRVIRFFDVIEYCSRLDAEHTTSLGKRHTTINVANGSAACIKITHCENGVITTKAISIFKNTNLFEDVREAHKVLDRRVSEAMVALKDDPVEVIPF